MPHHVVLSHRPPFWASPALLLVCGFVPPPTLLGFACFVSSSTLMSDLGLWQPCASRNSLECGDQVHTPIEGWNFLGSDRLGNYLQHKKFVSDTRVRTCLYACVWAQIYVLNILHMPHDVCWLKSICILYFLPFCTFTVPNHVVLCPAILHRL